MKLSSFLFFRAFILFVLKLNVLKQEKKATKYLVPGIWCSTPTGQQ